MPESLTPEQIVQMKLGLLFEAVTEALTLLGDRPAVIELSQVLSAVPDGWAKINGSWVQISETYPFTKGGHGHNCWYRSGGPCDCTAGDHRYWCIKREGPR